MIYTHRESLLAVGGAVLQIAGYIVVRLLEAVLVTFSSGSGHRVPLLSLGRAGSF